MDGDLAPLARADGRGPRGGSPFGGGTMPMPPGFGEPPAGAPVEHFGLEPAPDLVMAGTFSKAPGGLGRICGRGPAGHQGIGSFGAASALYHRSAPGPGRGGPGGTGPGGRRALAAAKGALSGRRAAPAFDPGRVHRALSVRTHCAGAGGRGRPGPGPWAKPFCAGGFMPRPCAHPPCPRAPAASGSR